MKVLQIINPEDIDSLITRLWEIGTLGIIEEAQSVKAYFPDTADLSSLFQTFSYEAVALCEEPNATSVLTAHENDEPILAGELFAIVSSATIKNPVLGRTYITIAADNAFGSGRHESTQLVIEALEKYLKPDSVLIDVGSGSGIISAVAAHLGAKSVIACDTHVDSAFLTRRHAPLAHVFVGSVDSISSGSSDIVVANISASVIDDLSDELNRVAKTDGWLILAGFIGDRLPRYFRASEQLRMNDWRCWICKPLMPQEGEKRPATVSIQPFPEEWW